MQDKQKVTLYLPPELHRQLKIRAALDSENMSALAQKALVFYLQHPEVVEEVEAARGQAHRVYNCPECASPVALRDGEMVSLGNQPSILEEEPSLTKVADRLESQKEEKLVTC
jgi:plasmid stability protein